MNDDTEVNVIEKYTDGSGRRYAKVELVIRDEHEGRHFETRKIVKAVLRPNTRRNDPRLNHAPK